MRTLTIVGIDADGTQIDTGLKIAVPDAVVARFTNAPAPGKSIADKATSAAERGAPAKSPSHAAEARSTQLIATIITRELSRQAMIARRGQK